MWEPNRDTSNAAGCENKLAEHWQRWVGWIIVISLIWSLQATPVGAQFVVRLPEAKTMDSIPMFAALRSNEPVRNLYGSAGTRWFDEVQGTLGTDVAFVSTSLLSGLMGRLFFDLSTAGAVAAAKGEEMEDNDVMATERSHFMRLTQNGGTVAARLALPIHAKSGSLWTRSSGIVANVGAIGSATQADSVDLTVGITGEWLNSLALADALGTPNGGRILIGIRAGYRHTFAERAFDKGNPLASFGFGQLALGIRSGDATLVSLLVTSVHDDRLKSLVPSVQFAIQATKP